MQRHRGVAVQHRVHGQSLIIIAFILALLVPIIFGLIDWYYRLTALHTAQAIANHAARAAVMELSYASLLTDPIPAIRQRDAIASGNRVLQANLAFQRQWTVADQQAILRSAQWRFNSACSELLGGTASVRPAACVVIRVPVPSLGWLDPSGTVMVSGAALFDY